jgi:DNA-binding CsgD family transcriptional regulator
MMDLLEFERVVSPMQKQVIQHVVNGYGNKTIASNMCLSDKTVKNHISAVFAKCKVQSRAHLTAMAITFWGYKYRGYEVKRYAGINYPLPAVEVVPGGVIQYGSM